MNSNPEIISNLSAMFVLHKGAVYGKQSKYLFVFYVAFSPIASKMTALVILCIFVAYCRISEDLNFVNQDTISPLYKLEIDWASIGKGMLLSRSLHKLRSLSSAIYKTWRYISNRHVQYVAKNHFNIPNILKLFVYKHTPLNPKQTSVEDVYSYFAVSNTLATSGQPTLEHFKIIQKSGYTAVINLATGDFIESPLENEAAIVNGLGMKYHHIPVDFSNPTNEDFSLFVKTMQNLAGDKVWVHCFLNARASAFVYKYRISVLGEDRENALWDLRELWESFGIWKQFVFGQESSS